MLHNKTIGAILALFSCCNIIKAAHPSQVTVGIEATGSDIISYPIHGFHPPSGEGYSPHSDLLADQIMSKSNPARSQSLPASGKNPSLAFEDDCMSLSLPPESPPPQSPSPKPKPRRVRSKSAGTNERSSRRRGSFKPGLASMEEVDESAHDVPRAETPKRGPAKVKDRVLSPLAEAPALKSLLPLRSTDKAEDVTSRSVKPDAQLYKDLPVIHEVKPSNQKVNTYRSIPKGQPAYFEEDRFGVPGNGHDLKPESEEDDFFPAALMHKSFSLPDVAKIYSGRLADMDYEHKERPVLHFSPEKTVQGKSLPTEPSIATPEEADLKQVASPLRDHSSSPLKVEDEKTIMMAPNSPKDSTPARKSLFFIPEAPEVDYVVKSGHHSAPSTPPDGYVDKQMVTPGSPVSSNSGRSSSTLKPQGPEANNRDLTLHDAQKTREPPPPVSPIEFDGKSMVTPSSPISSSARKILKSQEQAKHAAFPVPQAELPPDHEPSTKPIQATATHDSQSEKSEQNVHPESVSTFAEPPRPNLPDLLAERHGHSAIPPSVIKEISDHSSHSAEQLKVDIPRFPYDYASDFEYHPHAVDPAYNHPSPVTKTLGVDSFHPHGSWGGMDDRTAHPESEPTSPISSRFDSPEPFWEENDRSLNPETGENLKVRIPSLRFDSDSDSEYHLPGPHPISPHTPASPSGFESDNESKGHKISSVPHAFDILKWLEDELPHIKMDEARLNKILNMDEQHAKVKGNKLDDIPDLDEHVKMKENKLNQVLDIDQPELKSSPETATQKPVDEPTPNEVEKQIANVESLSPKSPASESSKVEVPAPEMKTSSPTRYRIAFHKTMERTSTELKKLWSFLSNILDKLNLRKPRSQLHSNPPSELSKSSHPETDRKSSVVDEMPSPSYSEAVGTIGNHNQQSKDLWRVLDQKPSNPSSLTAFTPPLQVTGA
ncbi:hypothetical protein PSHT_07112 [Puccinia striiformis]|uniref:Uncharacterized protein n=1 Tax=Puccinia striiformis TaxID=27350 RepID=A0A2S4W0Y9_9BASI|nr:hypothetical protein PSHT_07112 [Puccinia striiformis]